MNRIKCCHRSTFSQITKHFLSINQPTIQSLLINRSPILATQIIKACIATQSHSLNIMNSSINCLQRCQPQSILSSYLKPIEQYMRQHHGPSYQIIRNNIMPQTLQLSFPEGGYITVSTWNSSLEPQKYHKLICDLPLKCSIQSLKEFEWKHHHLVGKQITQYMGDEFISHNAKFINDRMFIKTHPNLQPQIKAFSKLIAYLEHSQPSMVLSGIPLLIKAIQDQNKQIQQLIQMVELLPYLNLLSPWHYFIHGEECCAQSQIQIQGNKPYIEKILAMIEKQPLQAQLLFNSIIKGVEMDKRTLILMDDHNYHQIYHSLKEFDWNKGKTIFQHFSLEDQLSQIIERQNAKLGQMVGGKLNPKTNILKTVLTHILYNRQISAMYDELIVKEGGLKKYREEMMDKYMKMSRINRVCDQQYIQMLKENSVERCSTIAYALNLESERERGEQELLGIMNRINSLV